jgi:putative membrane protein
MITDTVCYPGHAGFGWFPLIPLLFFGFWLVLFFVIRPWAWRRRGFGPAGYGGYGGPGGPGWSPSSSAEGVLAERFARGEVTEQEYRARLEVLRTRR